MALRNLATRMSCFSLISSIEVDLRNIIVKDIPDFDESFLPSDTLKIAKDRYFDDKAESYTKDSLLIDLLDYIDFYDLSKIIFKIKNKQEIFNEDEISLISTGVSKLTKCRNRVCHSRPLEPNDFLDLLDFTYELTKTGEPTFWKNINEAISNLDNPSYALSLEIPKFWRSNTNEISNNLPLPEFDDTGFLGRENDRKAICKLLTSNTRVVSIVGEGGVGKTALAQRCLYDILELCESKGDTANLFDMIVWVSLKTNRLTSSGAESIKDAINSSSKLFEEITDNFVGDSTTDIGANLQEISDYMETFKILLCIDNLETISNGEIRDFLANIPSSSKVLITTRMGLGEIEYRYKLDKLDDKPSISLMRSMSRLLNVEILYKKNQESLNQLCKRLYNNPLLIRWYVLAIAAGSNASDLLNKQTSSFQSALKFCFENLYDRLSELEKNAISVIACMRKSVSPVELRFILSDVEETDIEEALNQLHNSSMLISTENSIGQFSYSLTGIAEEYIKSIRPVAKDIYNLVKSKRSELRIISETTSIKKNHYNYDVNAIYWSSPDERICAIYLQKAISESRKENKEIALGYVLKAKSIMPEFSECYRIHAYLIKDESPFEAENELEQAIELAPKSVVTKYAYAQFLINEDDFERANEQITSALFLDPDDIALLTCKAWVLTLMGDYNGASGIYETIIPKQSDRHRKFRISTYDQAANCYIRMAKQYLNDSDFTEVNNSLVRAIELIDNAINDGDYDHGSIKRLCEMLVVANNYAKKSSDNSIIRKVFEVINSSKCLFTVNCIDALKFGLNQFSYYFPNEYMHDINHILQTITSEFITDKTDRIFGTIDRVSLTERGVSYGFILGLDGNRYFFHRSELIPQEMLDQNINIKNVTFVASKNSKGICAIEIKEA
ncbi:NB-ARC domain-containing protein [Shewanella xiamenensis]|uniref:NB-ARC domain-containing protein n=1 Tax=Shewanella xiamenensis TaxID=332186 RepID=UPI0035BAF77C